MARANRQAKRSDATRGALIEAARKLFAARGYSDVGTEEVVQAAGVTRGALYHHFTDKRDLFRAVHESNEEALVASIAARIGGVAGPLELLGSGVAAFLDACEDPALARISLIEAPTVLGWAEWREIDARYGLGLITAALSGGMAAGVLRDQPVKPLAHLLLSAMGEAGIMIASAEDPHAEREQLQASLLSLIDGLRA